MNMSIAVKLLPQTVLPIYLFFLLWLVLFKFSLHFVETFNFDIRGLNLIPFTEAAQNWKDVIFNCLFFVPLGLLMGVNLKHVSFWRKLTYVFLFSLAVEVFQYIAAIGITDVTDLLTNTTGGLVGLGLYSVNQRCLGDKRVDRWVALTIGVLVVMLSILIFTFQQNRDRHPPGSYTQSTDS